MAWLSRRKDDLNREIKANLITATKEAVRESRGRPQLAANALRDFRFALRTLRRRPAAYMTAVGVLALGIGMTTALYSLIDAVVLQPLPFPDQQELRVIWKDEPGNPQVVELAYPEMADLAEGVEAVASVALMPTTDYGNGRTVRARDLDPIDVDTMPVTEGFFRTLGVEPLLGRDFSSDDDARVAILSESFWRDHLSANPAVIGSQIELDGRTYEVIGLIPRETSFPQRTKIWLLLPQATDRSGKWLQALVRLKPGYTNEQFEAQVRDLFDRQAAEYPQFYPRPQLPVITELADYWTGASRLQLSISLGASLLLLVAAATTAGNLFLSRAIARKQEIAARTCLGATGGRMFLQFAAEGLAAGVFASALGFAIAQALIDFLVASAPAGIPRMSEAALRGDVLIVGIAVSFVTAFVCSVAPTWLATRLDPAGLLRDGSKVTGGRGTRLIQAGFIVAQTAVTVVLLAVSLFVALSFRAMLAEDIGFSRRDVLTLHLNPRGPGYDNSDQDAFYTELLARLRRSPLVDSAGAILMRPLAGAIGWDTPYWLDGEEEDPDQSVVANFQVVTPGYFETVGMTLLEGRDFTLGDDMEAEQCVIIGHRIAERLRAAGKQPIGSTIRLDWRDPSWRVIGVVENARYRGVRVARDDLYMNYLQIHVPVRYPVLRGRGSIASLVALVRQETAYLNPAFAVGEVMTMAELIDRDTAQQRFSMWLLLVFAAGSVALAGAGVYSVVAEHVAERRKELAIRIALGAERSHLALRVVAKTAWLISVGALVGVLSVFALGPLGSELLYSISPHDPGVLSFVVGFVVCVSLFAAFVPVWKATGQEPHPLLQAE